MTLSEQELIDLAKSARKKAYAPFSFHPVGVALLGKNGKVYMGCNVENSSSPVGICAEPMAVGQAVVDGCRDFEKIYVATKTGGFPCGNCRQFLYEFSPNLTVHCVDQNDQVKTHALKDLLPHGFRLTKADLEK